MSEYRRFVSYLYAYRKGRKENNCGFVKVEIRNGACRVRLRLQPPQKTREPLQVYGFVRNRGEILGIPLGTAQAKNNAYEFQAGYPAAAVGGTSYSIRDVRGVWLKGEGGETYITVWDDEPVEMGQFRALPEKTAAQEPAQESAPESAAGQARAETEAGAQETAVDSAQAAGQKPASGNAARQVRAEAETDAQETAVDSAQAVGQDPASGNAARQARAEMQVNAQAAMTDGVQVAGQEPASENATGQARAETQADASTAAAEQVRAEAETGVQETAVDSAQAAAQESAPESAAGQAHAETQTGALTAAAEQMRSAGWDSARSARQSDGLCRRWEQFLNHYPQIRPFADDEITQCIMIAPKDLSFLQKEEWHFSRNTFVRQAYVKYRHLMLGCHKSGRFVLAVPGTGRDPQEKQMARMYGFPYFKDIAGPQRESGVRAAEECDFAAERQESAAIRQGFTAERQGSTAFGQGSASLTGYWYHFLNETCPVNF